MALIDSIFGALRRGQEPGVELVTRDRPRPATIDDWYRAAVRHSPVAIIFIDSQLRVRGASAAAAELFQVPEPPESLILFTRTPGIELAARQLLSGAAGPWELDAPHFDRRLRVSGVTVEDGALMFLEDISELRRLEAVRTEFVANLAHELRTPVTSLRLAIETLRGDLPVADRRMFLDRVIQESDYLSSILDTLRELAELERGEVKLTSERFKLPHLVGETWDRVAATGSTVSFELSMETTLEVAGDRAKLAEVLQNLLENAKRYSPGDGVIEVGAELGPGQVTIWVEDQGIGISPSDLPRIFERFYKADRSRTRAGRGSGLGLAITKHLVEAHGGRIHAEPGAAGGTRVTFTLPQPIS